MTKQLLKFIRRSLVIMAFLSSRALFAGGDNSFYIYSNVYGGGEPWFTTTNSAAMDAVFGFGGWFQDYFETCDPDFIFSANTNFVFLEGSDGFADELESFLSVNLTLIEEWVDGGGRLYLNAAPNEGDGMSFGFDGVTLTYTDFIDNAMATDLLHPIFNGPWVPTGASWTGGSFAHASVSGGDITPLIVDSFDGSVAFAEGRYGTDGIVGFGGMTTNNFHSPLLESANLLNNIIYYIAYFEIPDHDVSPTVLVSPTNGCGLGTETITVTIKNLGTNPEVNIPVHYQIGAGPIINGIAPGPIAPGETYNFTFATAADLAVIGEYDFHVWTSMLSDEIPANDNLNQTITNIPVITSYPYLEGFEAGAGGWVSGGAASTWELGSPAGAVIAGPPPATPGSVNSWTTSLTGYYNNNEKSSVTSPCLDFSSLILPYIELDVNWNTESSSDGAKMQYSTDAGATWFDLGDVFEGINWYNSFEVYGMYPDFYVFDYRGWDGSSGGWKHAYLDLSFLGGESSVRIRAVFGADNFFNFNDGFAFDNVKIADLYNNDVGVTSIDEPNTGGYLTAAEPISVIVKNFGLLPQSGFPVSYTFEGGPAVTEIFTGTINPGESLSYSFATTEDLSVVDDYTFEAWTSLAGDEDPTNDMITEIVSKLIPVTGTDAYYIISNTVGGEPWGTVTNSAAMDAVFGTGEWTLGYFETIDLASVFSPATCFVFLEGSDQHAIELENFLAVNLTTIEAWVNSGGHLFLNAAPNEGDGMDFGFGGTHLNYSDAAGNVEASVPIHPIFDGPFTPTSIFMSGTSYSHASLTVSGGTEILHDQFTPSRIVCYEKSWGGGTVIFGGMTTTNFHFPAAEADNFRKNLISYLATCIVSDNDMGVANALSPTSACGLSNIEAITVHVKNYGILAQTNVPVKYQINGGPVVSGIVPGTIAPGETVEYTFPTTADLSVVGTYNIVAWTDLALDTVYGNDTTYYTVNNVPNITSFPYYENFESGSGGWIDYGSNSTWELGNPAGFAIFGPPPATPGSLNSWTTNLLGNYNNNEKSYVLSPCMDFTSLVLPYMEFDVNWDIQNFSDGAKIQYTLNEGLSWNDLGTVGEGVNWYNDFVAYGLSPDFFITDNRGWSGSSGGWKHAYYDMAFLGGEPSVRFRVDFGSDAFWNFNDGIAFDNMKIQDPYANDVGVVAAISPESDVDLSAAENVSVLIQNFGTLTQSGFNVAYRVNMGTIHTEFFAGTVAPGGTAIMSFVATEDFSADGSYAFKAWTELPTDADLTNDTLNSTIINLSPVTGTEAWYIYSNTTGGEPWGVFNNSDGMDVVFGDDGWFLGYFETISVPDVFDENTCFIYLEGSESQAFELENFLTINGSFIENWVASGGNLILNCAPNEGVGMEYGFDGVSMVRILVDNVTAADASHPIFSGPYTPAGTDYSGTSFGHGVISGGGIEPIIVNTFDASQYILAEKNWGSGHVLFGGMTPPNFHSPSPNAQNLLQNIYDYMKLCAPVDIGVTALISPEGGCNTGVEEITVTIENFGPSSVSTFPIKYSVNGGPEVSEFATLFIPAGGTGNYTFVIDYDFTDPDDYEVCVWTDISGDEDETNDLLCTTITSLESPVLELGANMTVCDEIMLDAGNIGSTYLWNTGATTETLLVTETGVYTVTVTNPTSGCSVTDNVTVTVEYTPVASFTYVETGLTVVFTNTSNDGSTFNWTFGDGGTSSLENPSHTYATEDSYTVTLTVTNGCGTSTISSVIQLGSAIDNNILADAVTIHPNPTSDVANITIELAQSQEIKLELANSLGQIVWSSETATVLTADYSIDMTGFAAGVYQLNIISGGENAAKPIILIK